MNESDLQQQHIRRSLLDFASVSNVHIASNTDSQHLGVQNHLINSIRQVVPPGFAVSAQQLEK